MSEADSGWPTDAPVTVVIPALNAALTLAAQLEALRAQTYGAPFEVIVVDNGSHDRTAVLARQFDSPEFTVRVVAEPRRGVNFARNAGIAQAGDGLIALCDADDIVFPNWLASFVDAYTAGVWLAGDLDPLRLNTPATRALWGVSKRIEHRGERPFLDTAFGGNCAFTRQMWEAIGRFDDSLSGHGDESEFFLRAWSAGFRVQHAPAAVIHYRLRPGLRNLARQRYRKGKSQMRLLSTTGGKLLDPAVRWSDPKSLVYIAVMAPFAPFTRRVRYPWVRVTALRAGQLVGRLHAWGPTR